MSAGHPGWLDTLGRECCGESAVVFAVAFGSRVAGTSHGASDLDVAVKFDESLTPADRFRALRTLSGTIQRSDAPFVDVADVESLPLAVAVRAVEGELLCGDEASFRRVKAAIEAEYAATADDLERHHRAVIDRIANGGLRGG